LATDKDILTGALSRMASYSTALPIAWPGVNFTPPSEGRWFEVRHFPNTPNNLAMGTDADQEFLGFLQVSVFDRPGSGIVNMTEEAEGIVAHFPKRQRNPDSSDDSIQGYSQLGRYPRKARLLSACWLFHFRILEPRQSAGFFWPKLRGFLTWHE